MGKLLHISAPPWPGVGRKIESLVRKAIFDFDLLEGAPKIGVALSGGKDSITLLYMLHAISGRGVPPFELHAFHVSGAFSCGASIDGGYLKAVCRELNVPLIVKHSEQKLETLECYSCSRKRRKLLFEAAKEVGVKHIAFGHHLDDHVETTLLNLLHKGEFKGNLPKVPMHMYGVTITRPLFYVEEGLIKTFSEQEGFARITCQCPVGQNSKRRQTKDLVKKCEEIFPNARKNLARAAMLYGSKGALSCN